MTQNTPHAAMAQTNEKKDSDLHLFVIGKEIWSSLDLETVRLTSDALEEAGLLFPPFEKFDIRSSMDVRDFCKFNKLKYPEGFDNISKDATFRYITKKDGSSFVYKYWMKDGKKFYSPSEMAYFDKESASSWEYFAELYISVLIALLATKNSDKNTEKIKRHGPLSKKRPREYSYITTIKIGKINETVRLTGESRGPVRAHLRRGHIRNQRIGEGRKETKQIFIQPVFVNADEGWIENQRREYRVKL